MPGAGLTTNQAFGSMADSGATPAHAGSQSLSDKVVKEGENTMMKRRILPSLLVAAATLLSYSGAAIAAEHEHQLKVGKTGEVTFDKETKVGDMTLKPGRYRFQHRVEGDDHFVHFTEWTKPIPSAGGDGSPKAHPGEVKCRIEPLSKKVSQTTIYTVAEGAFQRLTKVEVGGENVAHVF